MSDDHSLTPVTRFNVEADNDIFLDVLGMQVDLRRIVLDITAQAGAGNLLGNLLCAVAGLLDDPTGLAKLLNQILAILG